MDLLLTVVVMAVMTWMMTWAGHQSCQVYPPFKTKESSADFLAKSNWKSEASLLSVEENVFVRLRHCPVRVRIEEERSKATSMGNGSHSKEAETSLKKASNSQRKLKGSKRKRKKEKRKRFRKRKKRSSTKAKQKE